MHLARRSGSIGPMPTLLAALMAWIGVFAAGWLAWSVLDVLRLG
jgi:hypothetical protein